MCMHVCRETFVTLTAKLGKRGTQDSRFPAQSQLQEITTFPQNVWEKNSYKFLKGSRSREEVIVVLFQDKTQLQR